MAEGPADKAQEHEPSGEAPAEIERPQPHEDFESSARGASPSATPSVTPSGTLSASAAVSAAGPAAFSPASSPSSSPSASPSASASPALSPRGSVNRALNRALLAGLLASVFFWMTGSVMRNLLGVEHVLGDPRGTTTRTGARDDAAPSCSALQARLQAALQLPGSAQEEGEQTWAARALQAQLTDLESLPPEQPLTAAQERYWLEAQGLLASQSRPLKPGEEPEPASALDEPSHTLTLETQGLRAVASTDISGEPDTSSGLSTREPQQKAPLPTGLGPESPLHQLEPHASPRLVYLASEQSLFQYEPGTGRLQPLPLPLGALSGSIQRLLVDGTTLYLAVGQGEQVTQLLRMDASSGLMASMPLAPALLDESTGSMDKATRPILESVGLVQGTVWGALRAGNQSALLKLAATIHGVKRFELESNLPPILSLNGLPGGLLLMRADHSLQQFELASGRLEELTGRGRAQSESPVSAGKEPGAQPPNPAPPSAGATSEPPHNALDVTAWAKGVAISSTDKGLQFLGADGRLTQVDPHARMTHLCAQGRQLWGLESEGPLQILTRFNAALNRRVHYGEIRDSNGDGATSSSRERTGSGNELPAYGRVLQLIPWTDGVAVVTTEGIWRWRLSRQRFELLVRSIRSTSATTQSAPTRAASDVDAVLAQIAGMAPIERKAAYESLLQKGLEGYDEIFLMGLNEDDPDTLQSVVEYFRSHHPVAAIEPLLDVLLLIQGDKSQRLQLAQVLISFREPVIGPVVKRLTTETDDALGGGAREALEQVLVGAVEQGGEGLLNSFLAGASPEWLKIYGAVEHVSPVPPPVNAETFRILGNRLSKTDDPRLLDGMLRVLVRLARRPDLPPSVAELVPRLTQLLQGPGRAQALYGLALMGDVRALSAIERLYDAEPNDRFWSLQALVAMGVPEGGSILLSALRSSEPDVRLAATAVSRLELVPESLPYLRRQLLDEADGLCMPCVEALTTLRDPQARPILEARLARSRREEQVPLLLALAQQGDKSLAELVRGWASLEILAPARVKRLSLKSGPSFEVLFTAMSLVAAYDPEQAPSFLNQALALMPPENQALASQTLTLAQALPKGLAPILLEACLGPDAVAHPLGGVDHFKPLRPLLFALVSQKTSPELLAALNRILLVAHAPEDREEAARALFFLKDPSSRPSLEKALSDPYFQAGPFPQYYFPVRRAAARALENLGVKVERRADRSILVRDNLLAR